MDAADASVLSMPHIVLASKDASVDFVTAYAENI